MALKDKEARKAYQAEYFARNADRLVAANAEWVRNNKARKNEIGRAYRARNVEKQRAYREANREKMKVYMADYFSRNLEKFAIYSQNRRALKKASGGRLSDGLVGKLRRLQRNCCAVCRKVLADAHLDHVVPLFAGGVHADENMQLLCPHCNLSKGAKDPIAFMQSRGMLL